MILTLALLLSMLWGQGLSSQHRTYVRGYKIVGNAIIFDDSLPSGNTFHILFRSKPFDSTRHKITRKIIDSASLVTKIDGRSFFGTDGYMPTMEIDSFVIRVNGHELSFPRNQYSDLFNPQIAYKSKQGHGSDGINPYESKNGKYLEVEIAGSDGVGYYRVVFYFDHRKFLRRKIFETYG